MYCVFEALQMIYFDIELQFDTGRYTMEFEETICILEKRQCGG